MKTLILVKFAVEVLAGLAFLILPSALFLILLGVTLDASGAYAFRMFGAVILAIGVTCWLARKDSTSTAARGLLTATAFCDFVFVAIADCAESSESANRLSLSIDQACGTDLEAVLEARRWMAKKSGQLEDLVPLGALHADLREFDAADRIYQQALREYRNTSPFAVAWVCFQLGVLWGELVAEAQSTRAAYWYRKAIEYLPCYVKARVHLAELYLRYGRTKDAEALLVAAIPSNDSEVHWRLSDVLAKMGRFADAEVQMQTARSGFEALLEKHLLAFADHGAEFYSGSGNEARRA